MSYYVYVSIKSFPDGSNHDSKGTHKNTAKLPTSRTDKWIKVVRTAN